MFEINNIQRPGELRTPPLPRNENPNALPFPSMPFSLSVRRTVRDGWFQLPQRRSAGTRPPGQEVSSATHTGLMPPRHRATPPSASTFAPPPSSQSSRRCCFALYGRKNKYPSACRQAELTTEQFSVASTLTTGLVRPRHAAPVSDGPDEAPGPRFCF
ncbi:hypothetical protein DPEC_G00352930 [Dallia pectoralis]|uniref:Uncharacterized protein n=1 Tax=Dallia pectoralis TaxID=75939 RepID=A0ACC2F2H7_DALPE|nr:hypothetical protein DPEC_G00352930 [Dallia pectoralis]